MKRLIKHFIIVYVIVLVTFMSIAFFLRIPKLFIPMFTLIIWGVLGYPVYSERIKFKYFDPNVRTMKKIIGGDWIDLRAAETVELKAGEYKLIKLGVGMILPRGYEAHILTRSSTPERFGIVLANGMGVIDNSYSGDADEWHFPAIALRDTVIEKGYRIAQFRIVKNQPLITFKEVKRLRKKSRGGLGSTGRR